MKRFPLLLPLLVCSSFLVTGSLNRQGACPTLRAHNAPMETGLPDANSLLDGAAAAWAPDRLQWLETSVWQQVQGAESRFISSGRLRIAPGKRQRVELSVRVGRTQGQLLLVSDGSQVRRTIRVGNGEPLVSQRPISSPLTQGHSDLSDPLSGDLGTASLGQIMSGIKQHLVSGKVRRASWNGQSVYAVQGEWKVEAPRPGDVLPGMPAPTVPRNCTVLLNSRTLWPCRVEWSAENDRQTWCLEFRDPLVNQPLSPSQCANLFSVPAPN
jgi:hypothetical protein